jgi:tRNA methyl transferase
MKALVLFSGGLDSMISIKLLTSQGIEVTAIHIDIGFSGDEKKAEILRHRANEAGADFKIIDIRNEYLQNVLFNPKHGYGKHFNPCIDCHGYMFKTALAMLKSEGANFIATGEVIGQRPMSQRRDAMAHVKNEAGDEEDLILRPMSALLMKETRPEREGWVDRKKLLGISGRDRKRQLALAKEFGFSEFQTPGGGCLLTIESFSNKIRDFIKFDPNMSVDDMQLLRIGRHLRLKNGTKMVIGRDENDNEKLLKLNNKKFVQIKFLDNIVGAVSLIDINFNDNDLEFAARLALTYAKTNASKSYNLSVCEKKFLVQPFCDKAVAQQYFVN